MNRNNNADNTVTTPGEPNVEQLLRDAAFVLKLTRQVKNQMLRGVTKGTSTHAGHGTADRPHFGNAV